MNASSNSPQSSTVSAGSETGDTPKGRAPFLPPAVSDLGRLTELTLLGGSL